jgi:energy-coupling factor transport system permease protein
MVIEYRRGESLLHHLDPRTKLFMFFAFTVIALLFFDPILIGGLFLGLYLVARRSVGAEVINRSLRPLVAVFSVFFAFNILFFRPPKATFLFYLLPWWRLVPITVEGLIRSVGIFFRFFIVVLAVQLLLYTTPPADMVLGLTKRQAEKPQWGRVILVILLIAGLFFLPIYTTWQGPDAGGLVNARLLLASAAIALALSAITYWLLSRGLPTELGMALSIGFATVGILSEQARKITDAQKARGYELEYKNPGRRLRALTASFIPIFFATIERAQAISIAILARAFDFDIRNRTYRRVLTFQRQDYLVFGLLFGLLFLGLIVNYLGLGNPTERLVHLLWGL